MGRPTVHGKELVVKNGEFIGLNLGFNFYFEHEEGTQGIVQHMNMLRSGFELWGYNSKINKKINKEKKAIYKKWGNSEFMGYIVLPSVNYLRREIIIDNTEIRDKYRNFQTVDGEYTLLWIGNNWTSDVWNKKWGNRRKFREDELLYMPDYQSSLIRPDFTLNGERKPELSSLICGAWSSGDGNVMILVRKIKARVNIVERLTNALKRGDLAILPDLQGVFKEHGCLLVNLQSLHN